MSYQLLQLPRAKRQLRGLRRTHNPYLRAILKAISGLSNEPRPPVAEKLVGRPEWRIRIGEYRVIYSIADSERTVTIVAIAHQRNVYR